MVTGLRPGQRAAVTSRPGLVVAAVYLVNPRRAMPGKLRPHRTAQEPRKRRRPALPLTKPKKTPPRGSGAAAEALPPSFSKRSGGGLLFLDSPAGEPKPPQGGFGGRRPRGGSSPARRRSRSATGGNAVPPRTVFARLRGRCSSIGGRRRDSAFRPPLGGTYQGPSHADNVKGTLSRCPARQGAGSPKGARRAAARCEARHSRFLPWQECPDYCCLAWLSTAPGVKYRLRRKG